MGAKVDPTVSFGCRGASSQTRLDLSACGKSYLWYSGRRNGSQRQRGEAGVKGITDLPPWPKHRVRRRAFHPARGTGDFPVDCLIGRLLLSHVLFRGQRIAIHATAPHELLNPRVSTDVKAHKMLNGTFFYCNEQKPLRIKVLGGSAQCEYHIWAAICRLCSGLIFFKYGPSPAGHRGLNIRSQSRDYQTAKQRISQKRTWHQDVTLVDPVNYLACSQPEPTQRVRVAKRWSTRRLADKTHLRGNDMRTSVHGEGRLRAPAAPVRWSCVHAAENMRSWTNEDCVDLSPSSFLIAMGGRRVAF